MLLRLFFVLFSFSCTVLAKEEGGAFTVLSIKDFLLTADTWLSAENITLIAFALVRIVVILVVFKILWHGLNRSVDFYLNRIPLTKFSKLSSKESSAIVKTLAPIIRSTLHWILIVLTVLLVLSELNINIMPIIYSFSVITLAISLGSQTLVKDLINGALTLFEGNMAVGDFVIIGSHSGVVESISLRCVYLRHGTGELQTIPFSEVSHVTNCSRDYNVADIRFIVSYQTDLKETDAALKAVYDNLKKHPRFKSYIKNDLIIYGVSDLQEWGAIVHAEVKIIPDPAKAFLNEFKRLLLEELQLRNIPMPTPVLLGADARDRK